MGGPASLFVLALSLPALKTSETTLRTGCEAGDDAVAQVPAGSPVKIRFALNGCYAVSVEAGGRTVQGFLPASAIQGIEEFERERRGAPSVVAPAAPRPAAPTLTANAVVDAQRLLSENRPNEALEILQVELSRRPRDPHLLAMAGHAALRNDESLRAIGFLKDSLAIRPDPNVERLLGTAEREAGADSSTQKLVGTRFALRYDPRITSADSARAALAGLEDIYSRLAFELGCRTEERVSAVLQSREAYLKGSDAAEWSGGRYDGRIRVALLDAGGIGPETQRVFAHEAVHACLSNLGTWPAWLHEGLAQRLSGQTIPADVLRQVQQAARSGALPKLNRMTQTWSRLSANHARLAYAAAFSAVNLFYEHYAEYGIRNLLKSPERLPQVADQLDALLRR